MTPEEQFAYSAGLRAYLNGESAETCPFPSWGQFGQFNNWRYCWFNGWHEGRELQRES